MQQKLVGEVKITPAEVRRYYQSLPQDSIPYIPTQVEVQIITQKPRIPVEEVEEVKKRLREFTDRINKGEISFSTLARMYSEDRASAINGGEMPFYGRGQLDPSFANVAFNLQDPTKVSKVVESEYGFHIIQLIDRQGEKINVRHIILQPKVSDTEKQEALNRLDTIRQYITDGKMTFEEAAYYFSTDKKTRNNGGLFADPQTSEARIARPDIPGDMAREVNKMKPGEISQPFISHTNGQEEYKIVKIKEFYPRHKANLDDDWQNFELMLKREKQMEKLEKWIKEKQADTYIHIDESFKDTKFRYDGWIK